MKVLAVSLRCNSWVPAIGVRFKTSPQVWILLAFGLTLFACGDLVGQTAGPLEVSSQPADAPHPQLSEQLLEADSIISPDDMLDVYVLDAPEFSHQYRVSPAGTVAVPLVRQPVKAAGLTVSEFSESLARQLRDSGMVSNPHITVSITSSRLKSVAVTGAVRMPQIYPVFGHTTLLDILSQAQGLSGDAGHRAIISRGEIGARMNPGEPTVQTVDLKKLMDSGDPKLNINIYPGDRVTIPRGGVIYVVGAVHKPGGFTIQSADDGISVLQAIALAEDVKPTAVKNKTTIIRVDPAAPEGRKQIAINLDSILAGKAPDTALRADDILFVPDSAAKKAFIRGMEAAVQTATGLAIYGRY